MGSFRTIATWDALRYLAARVELLEARVDPLGMEVAELPVGIPDPRPWVPRLGSWFEEPATGLPIIVGELGDGTVLRALTEDGHRVRGVDPRGGTVWGLFSTVGPDERPPDLVMSEVADHLRSVPEGGAAGVVLVGCVDRLDLPSKLDLLAEAVRATMSGGTVVLLATHPAAWDESVPLPIRDLLPGRPLHPETWLLLLGRSGAHDLVWHRPDSGDVHAVVAKVER